MNTQTQVQNRKEVLSIIELTEEQIRQENRDYNPSAWDKIIDRKTQLGAKFYVARPQNGFSYDRYYAIYTIPEGINFMGEVSYCSGLTNRGFCLVEIDNGKLYKKLLKDINGNYGYCANDKQNRLIMAKNSKNFGVIYSNNF